MIAAAKPSTKAERYKAKQRAAAAAQPRPRERAPRPEPTLEQIEARAWEEHHAMRAGRMMLAGARRRLMQIMEAGMVRKIRATGADVSHAARYMIIDEAQKKAAARREGARLKAEAEVKKREEAKRAEAAGHPA